MADEAKKRAEILLMAKAQGKTLRPEHEAELKQYQDMGIVASPQGKTRPMSDGSAKAFEDQVAIYGALKSAVNGFRPEYAGNTITGGMENVGQSLNSSIGTPGQRDWWSAFRTSDNLIRNDLFGAALTDTEKKAYEETTISERMDPVIVEQNLSRRAEIIRKAMARRTDFMKKNRVDPDAVDALAGEYVSDFSPDYKPPVKAGDPIAMEFQDAAQAAEVAKRLTPEQQDEFTNFITKNKDSITPERVNAWMVANGFGPLANAEAYVKGVKESKSPTTIADYSTADEQARQQARERMGGINSAPVAAAAGLGDALTVGLQDKAIAGVKTAFGDRSYDENLRNTRADASALATDHPYASLAGQVGGLIGGEIGIGRAVPKIAELMGSGGTIARAMKGVGADATYSGAYGYNKSDGDPAAAVDSAALGAGASVLGRTAASGLGRVLSPVGDAAVDMLRAKGVPITPGQALGPAAARMEEKLQSFPIIGDMINSARGKAETGFNSAVINDALKPLGVQLPDGATGSKAMKFAQKAFDDAYSEARGGMHLVADDGLAAGIRDLSDRATNGEFSIETAQRLGKIYKSQVERRLKAGVVSGSDYKDMHSSLGKLIDGAKRAQNTDLADALGEMQSIIDVAAKKSSPIEAVEKMEKADEGYAQFVRAENAAKMRGGEAGTFSAKQYDSAVQKGDNSVRSKAYLRGEALGQPLATAGKDIIGDSVNNSGTMDRIGAAALLGGAGTASYFDPTGASPYVMGGLAAAYLPGVRQGVVKAITGKRSSELRSLGDFLRENNSLAGSAAIPLALPRE